MKNISLNQNNSDISNQKLATILNLVEKRHTKRLIDLKSLIVQIILAKRQSTINYSDTTKGACCVYYCNKYILNFLKLLKDQGFIFNYYIIPFEITSHQLPVVMILFNYNLNIWLNSLREIKLVSTTNKMIFATWINLKNLTRNYTSKVYIISTVSGLITHSKALEKKIGGKILCIIK